MMTTPIPSGKIIVEGRDDEHTIKQLLARHGIEIHSDDCPLRVHRADSDSKVINDIPVYAKESGGQPIGFVLDTDPYGGGKRLSRVDRWRSIRTRLIESGVELASSPADIDLELPRDGFIGNSTKYSRAIGIWLMPDNRSDFGTIEDLLATLIPSGDELFQLAVNSTDEAIQIAERLRESRKLINNKDRSKGQLHAWLSWHEEPGMPYGQAIRSKYFGHDSVEAKSFVGWFRRLFQ